MENIKKNWEEKDVRHFAADLADLLIYSIDIGDSDLQHLANLLLLSAGIKRVEFDGLEFDRNLGWCSEADRFRGHQNKLEQLVVNSLTRFMFLWASLEAAVNISLQNYAHKASTGKINRLCAYLKNEFEPRNVSSEYKDLLDQLNKLAWSDSLYSKSIQLKKAKSYIGISGYGVFSVYSIRNCLAHGSLGVPISKEDEEEFMDVKIIDCCSKIVLHTLQMLFTSYFSKHIDTVSWRGEDVDFEILMRVFHLDISICDFEPEDNDLFCI